MTKQNFDEAVIELLALAHSKAGGMPAGVKREAALIKALVSMASLLGTAIQDPIRIDSRGEISIVCTPGSKGYGEAFANWLNQGSPRTGIYPGAIMTDTASWCRMNHFEVEKIVIKFSESEQYSKI
ncbi:hypothetical protein [Comamonas thiooxydans]|uniref:hypothetical protein n=1 Tax=Comamonas thiooxydans TaxID=363952 RepID=UPI000B408AE7|nr:hypothetical protein [Comamonas thiooxydans]